VTLRRNLRPGGSPRRTTPTLELGSVDEGSRYRQVMRVSKVRIRATPTPQSFAEPQSLSAPRSHRERSLRCAHRPPALPTARPQCAKLGGSGRKKADA
jgi:hypothetical protein